MDAEPIWQRWILFQFFKVPSHFWRWPGVIKLHSSISPPLDLATKEGKHPTKTFPLKCALRIHHQTFLKVLQLLTLPTELENIISELVTCTRPSTRSSSWTAWASVSWRRLQKMLRKRRCVTAVSRCAAVTTSHPPPPPLVPASTDRGRNPYTAGVQMASRWRLASRFW